MSQPAPYGAPGAPAAHFSTGDAIGYGWRAFTRYAGPMILLALVVLAAQLVVNLVDRQLDNAFASFVWRLVGYVVSLVLTVGIYRAALAVLDGRKPEVGMLARGDGVLTYFLASLLVGIGIVVGLILLIIPGLIVLFVCQFFGLAAVEDPSAGPLTAIRRSFEVVKDNIGQVLLLDLAIIGILIVGLLLLGVGLLVAYPVVLVGQAYAWRRATRGQVASLA